MKIVLDEEFKDVLNALNGCKHEVLDSFFKEVVSFSYNKKYCAKNKKRYMQNLDKVRTEGVSFEKDGATITISRWHICGASKIVVDKVFKCETQGSIWEGTYTVNRGDEKDVYNVEINKAKNIVKCNKQKERTK